jgi:hypothetical protein
MADGTMRRDGDGLSAGVALREDVLERGGASDMIADLAFPKKDNIFVKKSRDLILCADVKWMCPLQIIDIDHPTILCFNPLSG